MYMVNVVKWLERVKKHVRRLSCYTLVAWNKLWIWMDYYNFSIQMTQVYFNSDEKYLCDAPLQRLVPNFMFVII